MKKLYIMAQSKAELNSRISNAEDIIGTEYNAFNPDGYITQHILKNINEDCIIAIYRQTRINEKGQSIPIAHVWGTYNPHSGGGTYIY